MVPLFFCLFFFHSNFIFISFIIISNVFLFGKNEDGWLIWRKSFILVKVACTCVSDSRRINFYPHAQQVHSGRLRPTIYALIAHPQCALPPRTVCGPPTVSSEATTSADMFNPLYTLPVITSSRSCSRAPYVRKADCRALFRRCGQQYSILLHIVLFVRSMNFWRWRRSYFTSGFYRDS